MARSVGISIDHKGGEPIYKQIANQITLRIRSGAFPAGFKLPPTRALAAELATHRNTVVRAYDELEAAGLVESGVGRGTFVAAAARAPKAPTKPSAPQGPSLPWESLISNAGMLEPLRRHANNCAQPVGDTIDLRRMQPSVDLLPADLFRRCVDHTLRTRPGRALGYAPRDGAPRLCALIAEDLERQGVPARPEDIIVTTGSQQAIDVIARTIVHPGDCFLVNRTTYSGAIDVLTAAGARLIGVPSDDEGPDPAVLERLASSRAKGLYLMPNCHNPTGEVVSRRRREFLVEWSHRARIPIIEDDYGSDLVLEDEELPPSLRALDADVVYIGTFSKKLVPAARVGFIICPRPLRAHVSTLRHAMDLGTSALMQHALAEFLERGYLQPHLKRVRAEYRARRDALEGQLASSLPGSMRWRSPRTGVVLWLPLPGGLGAAEVTEEARRHGVAVLPGSQFAAGSMHEEGIRLTFCSEAPERLQLAARRLGKAISVVEAARARTRRTSRDTELELFATP